MIRAQWMVALFLLDLAVAQELPPVSGLPHPVVLRRIPAEDRWDIVVALSSAFACQQAPRPCWWNTRDRLAILLQDRGDPGKLLPLAVEPGPNDDCSTRVERFTPQELVMSCVGEKWSTYENQKFVYDVRARKLINHLSYLPFAATQVLAGPRIVMAAGERRLVVDIDAATGDPRVTTSRAPEPGNETDVAFGRFRLVKQKNRYGSEYTVIVGGDKAYPLAQTVPQQDLAEMNEQIGPHRVEDGRLWFGKTFYNGEGLTGVGGFGYFDSSTASYHLFAPSEMAAWSVSAILVEADAVWMSLYHRGAYGNNPGGLLRWDRHTQTVRRWEMPWIATGIARSGDAIYMGTTDGIAVVRGDRVASYFVDRTAAGQYRMAAR